MSADQGAAPAASAILPFSYGGSNGLLTQDTNDAELWRRFGTSRLARTVCAAPTGAANEALYGKMPGVAYEDYPQAPADRALGRQPWSVRHPPRARSSRRRSEAGAKLVVIDPRRTSLAKRADLHLPCVPGTDLAVALALHRDAVRGRIRGCAHSSTRTRRASDAPARRRIGVDDRARRRRGRRRGRDLRRLAAMYIEASPALDPLRLGPRAESQRWKRGSGRSSRCRPSPESSACAAAATR